MTRDTQQYAIGWKDYRTEYGEPNFQIDYFHVRWWWKLKLALAYAMLALSLTMVFMPMAWVNLIKWMLS